jgi:hypothetical protein
MYAYQLGSKDLDQRFLDRKLIECEAVVPEANAGALIAGSKVVVQLSNKSKYMAVVREFKFAIKNGHAEGFLYLQRP